MHSIDAHLPLYEPIGRINPAYGQVISRSCHFGNCSGGGADKNSSIENRQLGVAESNKRKGSCVKFSQMKIKCFYIEIV